MMMRGTIKKRTGSLENTDLESVDLMISDDDDKDMEEDNTHGHMS